MKKKIFITGAAGFIGFHLAKALAQRGDLVVGYDNFNPYYLPSLKRDRASALKKEGIHVIDGDVCDAKTLEEAVFSSNATHLVHLAAQAGVRYSLQNPKCYTSSNIEGFLSILELVRKRPEIKLIYASSSSVYGLNQKAPFSEQDRTDRQASLYGVTKKCNELMAATYHHLFNLSVTGLRFFTVYGPWGRPDMAYFSFSEAILQEKPIQLFNFGKMKRDFTYIDDIISGTIAAIDRESACEIFNLGGNHPVALHTFVETLEELLGKKAKIEFATMQAGDVPATFADISHSQNTLKFLPKTSLHEGLSQFVNWYLPYRENGRLR